MVMVVIVVMMMVVIVLHSLCQDFLVGVRRIHHRDQLCRMILRGVQHIIDPGVRNAAHVAEHIRSGNGGDILN